MSALPKAASAPKSVETLDKCDGHCRAEQCRMRSVSDSVSDNDALNQVERLVAELRAIERWDADHWRKCDSVIQKHTKWLLLWPVEQGVLKFCLN